MDTTSKFFRGELIDPTVFIADGAIVVGAVHLAAQCSVWFNAVLRGDVEALTIGERSNIQDGCLLHTSHGFPLIIGAGVTVGHGAVIHGAQIGDNTLIGMRALLLDGVVVGADCLVAAGALLTPGKHFPPGSLIMGSPARVVRALTAEEIAQQRDSAQHYVELAAKYQHPQKESSNDNL